MPRCRLPAIRNPDTSTLGSTCPIRRTESRQRRERAPAGEHAVQTLLHSAVIQRGRQPAILQHDALISGLGEERADRVALRRHESPADRRTAIHVESPDRTAAAGQEPHSAAGAASHNHEGRTSPSLGAAHAGRPQPAASRPSRQARCHAASRPSGDETTPNRLSFMLVRALEDHG